MSELRWVLLVLGAVVIGITWVWGSGIGPRWFSRLRGASPRIIRREPVMDDGELLNSNDPGLRDELPTDEAPVGTDHIDRIVTVRFIPRTKPMNAETAILALRSAGLRHGAYGIFHMHADTGTEQPMFSVANLTEPGSFELSNLSQATIPGMNFFMVLPGSGDPIEHFDKMVDTARSLARTLDADLHDERGNSWSVQRQRYVREEIIEYRHRLDRRR
jgi:FtsZ-interacting cell division protein ZipA